MKVQIGAETAAIPLSDREAALERHEYKDPRTGRVMPFSVTDIVRAYQDGDLLGAGAAAATKLGPGYREIWDESGNRGTRIHLGIGDWANGRPTNVLDGDWPYYQAFRAFCDSMHPEWLETERPCISARGVGGRFDLFGYLDGLYTLIDIKTGKEYLKELALQCAGYASMDGMLTFDAEGNATGVEPLPHIERWCGLYLNEEGTAKLIEVPRPERGDKRTREERQRDAIVAFNHLLEVRKWARPTKREK